MSQFHGPVYPQSAYAGFWRRSLALFIDFFILGFTYFVVDEWWWDVLPEEWVTREIGLQVYFGLVLLCIAYCFLFRLSNRGTPGYRIMRIEYAPVIDGNTGMLQVLFRAAVALYMFRLMFYVDHGWILFDDRKQAWHDKVSGFYVIKRGSMPTGSQPIRQRLVNFATVSMIIWEPAPTANPDESQA